MVRIAILVDFIKFLFPHKIYIQIYKLYKKVFLYVKSNLYYKAESYNARNEGVILRAMNGGCTIKSEEWRVYDYR